MPTIDIDSLFTINLICNGIQTEIYKEYLFLSSGEEATKNPSIPLITDFIGRSTGTCKIKPILGEEYILTEEFTISDKINIKIESEKTIFNPEETITIEGTAIKENGLNAEGFIEISLANENIAEPITISDTVKNGFFLINFSLPTDTKAGEYFITMNIQEKDSKGQITNQGLANYNIEINKNKNNPSRPNRGKNRFNFNDSNQ
jgi:hypothetical protein